MSLNIEQLQQHFESAAPQDILAWGIKTFGEQLAVVTSFQKTGMATLHMLQTIAPQLPILTLDTGNLFPETLAFIEQVESEFRVNLIRVRPPTHIPDDLWKTDTDRCCDLRKVQPLDAALKDYRVWVAGVRRDQSTTRANTPIITRDRRGLVKLAPFANWTEEIIDTYIAVHKIPTNPLYDMGYTSIGCAPCTRPVTTGEDMRAGRWSDKTKTECGIHLNG